jgi:hypothetical protein
MKTLRIDCCLKVGVDSYCVILIADEETFFVPLMIDGEWGAMVYKFLSTSSYDEGVMLNVETALSIMQQTDIVILFSELEYNEEINDCEASIVGYRSNEIGKKFYTIDMPLPYVLMLSAGEKNVQLVMDEDSIEVSGKRPINELEGYISEHNIG